MKSDRFGSEDRAEEPYRNFSTRRNATRRSPTFFDGAQMHARGAPGSTSSEVKLANDVDRLLVELERGDRLRRDLEGQVEDLEIVLRKR